MAMTDWLMPWRRPRTEERTVNDIAAIGGIEGWFDDGREHRFPMSLGYVTAYYDAETDGWVTL